jgi:HAE1 family hydrophobic/amphiphilic exporter-1
MMIGALLVLGMFSYRDLSVEMFPEVDFPIIVVQTYYSGASAEAVESEVSEKIEEAGNQVTGVRHIQTTSREGISVVVIEFQLEVDGVIAAQDVREKVSAIRGNLPDDIDEPIVSQWDMSAEPILSLALSGRRSAREITQLAKDIIKPRLEPLPGVGGVQLVGGSEREIRVFIDPQRMEAMKITVDDIRFAVASANLDLPGGRIDEAAREYLIRMQGRLTEVQQFDSIIVKHIEGTPIYLADVANVVDTIAEQRSLSRYNGNAAIGIDIVKQSGANVVEVALGARKVVEELQKELPPDVTIDIVSDNSIFIQDSIHEIETNIMLGTTLAVIVIFLFLLDLKPTTITGLSIPISIIATFTLIKFLGFSINFMTLLGLSLSVGILVDDAIVVVENIYRHLDEGKSPVRAAIDGTAEIGLAVSATTFCIIAVFVPVAFMEGIIGRFFYQFGMTVAFAVLISLFVAFTLTPMLSAQWFKRVDEKIRRNAIIRFLSLWNAGFDKLKPLYERALAYSLRRRWLVTIIALGTFAFSLFMAGQLGQEFMPEYDESRMQIVITVPPGTDLKESSDRIREVEDVLSGLPEVKTTYVTIGRGSQPVNEGSIRVSLVEPDERIMSANELMDSVRILLAEIPGMKTSISKEGGHDGGKPIEVSIRGGDLAVLTSLVHQVEERARAIPGSTDIDNTLEEGTPEIQVNVDRQLARDLGLNIQSIAMTVRNLIEGDVVTRFKEGDEEYDVRVQLATHHRESADGIDRLLIESTKEIPGISTFLVPLGRVATIERGTDIGKLSRYDREREVRVNGNVLSGFFAGTITNELLLASQDIELPPGYSIGAVGTQEFMVESFQNILLALAMAIVFIYLLLASQYESFFDPLSIMVSLPLSLIGAVFGLLVFNTSMNIMSMIGIVMLMGLVTKNAILLIDFVKQRRAQGMGRTEAILLAGPIRLRPILMTAFATVFGMLPLALGLGPGAEMRAGMARAVIGGMISSTFLTLIVVPVVYAQIDDVIGWVFGRKKDAPAEDLDEVRELS